MFQTSQEGTYCPPSTSHAENNVWQSDPESDVDSQAADSDSELQERHLQRLMCGSTSEPSSDGNFVSGVPSRDAAVYLSVQPAQRVKSGERLKRISSEEHVDAAAAELSTGVTTDSLSRWQHQCDLTDAVTSLADPTNQSAMPQLREIQLRRGWSARLGFSVQTVDGAHIVSHIHPESVAARDGRLRLGDTLVKVNGESLDELSSDQVIDLLRKTRATVNLHVIQRY